jgi:hypothetical protein
MTAVDVTPKAIKKALAEKNATLPLLTGRFVAKTEKSMGNVVAFTIVFEPPVTPPGEDLSCTACGMSAHSIAVHCPAD